MQENPIVWFCSFIFHLNIWTHRTVCVAKKLIDHLVALPCHGQGHLPLDQVAQRPIQPGLEHFQRGASTAFLGNLFQCPTAPIMKIFFLISNLNLPSFHLKPLRLVLCTPCPCKKSFSGFLIDPFSYRQAAIRSSQSLLFPKLNNSNSLSLSS